MSDVMHLLHEATPLPWRPCTHLEAHNTCTCGFYGEISSETADELVAQMGPCHGSACVHPEGCGVDMVPVASEARRKANGQLIVYSVNHLPDYEAAVDWLDDLVTTLELASEDGLLSFDSTEPRAVLNRLRRGVSA